MGTKCTARFETKAPPTLGACRQRRLSPEPPSLPFPPPPLLPLFLLVLLILGVADDPLHRRSPVVDVAAAVAVVAVAPGVRGHVGAVGPDGGEHACAGPIVSTGRQRQIKEKPFMAVSVNSLHNVTGCLINADAFSSSR